MIRLHSLLVCCQTFCEYFFHNSASDTFSKAFVFIDVIGFCLNEMLMQQPVTLFIVAILWSSRVHCLLLICTRFKHSIFKKVVKFICSIALVSV